MRRPAIVDYALFALAYGAIWLVLLAPQTVASMVGTAPKASVAQGSNN